MRLLTLILFPAVLCFALPAAAQIDPARLGEAHFVGHWSLDGPEGCGSSDTLSFYGSGAWAVTNGGDNPVEVLGTWSIGAGALQLRESDLRDPLSNRNATVIIDSVLETQMEITLTYSEGGGRSFTLDRCA